MKSKTKILTLAVIVFLGTATVAGNYLVDDAFFNKNRKIELVYGSESSAEKSNTEDVKIKERSASSTVFNHNFLFNLIYKFAHRELSK